MASTMRNLAKGLSIPKPESVEEKVETPVEESMSATDQETIGDLVAASPNEQAVETPAVEPEKTMDSLSAEPVEAQAAEASPVLVEPAQNISEVAKNKKTKPKPPSKKSEKTVDQKKVNISKEETGA